MYPWQNEEGVRNKARALEERRVTILEQLGEGNDIGVQESLLTEWLELVRERDRMLREEVEEVNEKAKVECLVDLHRVLKDLGGLVSTGQEEDVALRRDMASLYRQVETFCTEHAIATEPSPPAQAACPPPPPAPPLPPPPLPPMTMGATTLYKAKRKSTESGDDTREDGVNCPTSENEPALKKAKAPTTPTPRFTQQTPFRHESPLQTFNKHLIMSISGGLVQRQLKRTSGVRSPGGTPVRKERQLDASDPCDAIALALQKKFRNVPIRSPLTPCDENNADASNMSDAFASPVLEPSMAKRASAGLVTASAEQSPAVKENTNESFAHTL
eukprot:scpid71460/ scgid23318/ 